MTDRKHLGKLLLALLVLCASVLLLLMLSENNSLTAEMAFRRKEKRNLIGPAEILETLNFENNRYDHLMIGRSEYGYTFYEWTDNGGWDNGTLTYQPKTEGATLYCTKYHYLDSENDRLWLPIFAFTDNSAAIGATLTLTTTQEGKTVSYPLTARKSKAGYFLFSWDNTGVRALDFWMVQQMITGQYRQYVLEGTVQATLELYDAHGTLLESFRFSKQMGA